VAVPVTATIITFNEAANIEAALASLSWADEIIVVDRESTDNTTEIARKFTGKVIVRPWPGYVAQKNFAAEQASHDWIFSLDADERVTPELAAEIKAALAREPRAAGYRVPRVTFHLGRWMRSTDWYPDYQLRLYDRRRARWAG
jgi:glycosyltransferase involved in cell wall biosynthesis